MGKHEIWSLDTEDDSKGNVRLIDFFDGTNHYTFRNSADALEFLGERPRAIHIWATNLGYDIANLFRDCLGVLTISYIGSRVISAQIVGTSIYFKDTLNHWKISVKEMGERIGLHKLEDDLFKRGKKPTLAQLTRRCHRDNEITRTFVVKMATYYEEIGAELKSTIGSTSLDFYYKHYGTKRPNFLKTKDIEFMLTGYYGGRTEIFHTKPVEGDSWYFDFNSLYPSVMKEHLYPILSNFYYTKKPDFKLEGMIYATVEAPKDLDIPYLPFRTEEGKLIFPLGRFKGCWTYYELRRAMEIGYRICKVHKAIEFGAGTFRPFEKFVQDLYQKRLDAQKIKDSLLAETLKLLMNNLYGKFAQGNEITKLIPFSKKEIKNGDTIFGDCIVRKQKSAYPPHTNVIWAAYTTAFGRDRLWRAMQEVKKHRGLVLYCDTDSVIFKARKPIFENSSKLGELKLEKKLKYVWFKAPKLYCLIEKSSQKHIYRAKGVPRKSAKTFFLTGRARFRKPHRLRESLRRKLTMNYWSVTEKEHRSVYDKRIIEGRSGKTRPITLTG